MRSERERSMWRMRGRNPRNTVRCLSTFTVSSVVSSARRSGATLNTFEWLHLCAGVPCFTCYIDTHLLPRPGGLQLILGWRSFNVGTTARINHTALFFHGVCFVLFLCSFGNISAGVIRLQQIRRCFDDLIKLQSGCFAQNWDPKEERCTVSVSYWLQRLHPCHWSC